MTKLVEFYDDEDKLALKIRIQGCNRVDIELKAHRLLLASQEEDNPHYYLYLQSVAFNWHTYRATPKCKFNKY